MSKNTGGAKPKTIKVSSRPVRDSSSSSSQTVGPSRHRSPRRDSNNNGSRSVAATTSSRQDGNNNGSRSVAATTSSRQDGNNNGARPVAATTSSRQDGNNNGSRSVAATTSSRRGSNGNTTPSSVNPPPRRTVPNSVARTRNSFSLETTNKTPRSSVAEGESTAQSQQNGRSSVNEGASVGIGQNIRSSVTEGASLDAGQNIRSSTSEGVSKDADQNIHSSTSEGASGQTRQSIHSLIRDNSSGQGSVRAGQTRQNGLSDYSRPVLRPRNVRNVEPVAMSSDESSMSELPSVSRVPGVRNVGRESQSDRSVPPLRSLASPESTESLNQLAALRPSTSRPMSSSPDARLARELLQEDMAEMMDRDEQLARQLQDDLNNEGQPSPLDFPLSMFLPGGPQARGRHMLAGRTDGGRRGQPGEHATAPRLRLVRGPDGNIRMGFAFPARGRPLQMLMRAARRGHRGSRGERSAQADNGEEEEDAEAVTSDAEQRPRSPDEEGNLPSGEFEPEERVLADQSDSPDDFLSMMHDPSLMLLMLMLRAPDAVNQNETNVDPEDYEGLWELAERLGEVRRRGITEDQLKRLPTVKVKEKKGEERGHCQICLVEFETGDCLRCIPCKHDFHKDCIDQWLKRNATCPICRQEVTPRRR